MDNNITESEQILFSPDTIAEIIRKTKPEITQEEAITLLKDRVDKVEQYLIKNRPEYYEKNKFAFYEMHRALDSAVIYDHNTADTMFSYPMIYSYFKKISKLEKI